MELGDTPRGRGVRDHHSPAQAAERSQATAGGAVIGVDYADAQLAVSHENPS